MLQTLVLTWFLLGDKRSHPPPQVGLVLAWLTRLCLHTVGLQTKHQQQNCRHSWELRDDRICDRCEHSDRFCSRSQNPGSTWCDPKFGKRCAVSSSLTSFLQAPAQSSHPHCELRRGNLQMLQQRGVSLFPLSF